eukprot:scaffold22390_cov28-Tisochrysis_lutea.AAC.13
MQLGSNLACRRSRRLHRRGTWRLSPLLKMLGQQTRRWVIKNKCTRHLKLAASRLLQLMPELDCAERVEPRVHQGCVRTHRITGRSLNRGQDLLQGHRFGGAGR